MRFSLFLSLASLAPLLAVGCGAKGGDPTGGAGTTGGAGAGGSSAPLPPGLGQGGPFPFPQNKRSGSCTITSVANAGPTTLNAYNSWKSTFVTATGAGAGLRVQSPQHSGGTVSEGIGYGMIAAVYTSDRPTFDGLWTYAKAHFDAKGLMNWKITSGGTDRVRRRRLRHRRRRGHGLGAAHGLGPVVIAAHTSMTRAR